MLRALKHFQRTVQPPLGEEENILIDRRIRKLQDRLDVDAED